MNDETEVMVTAMAESINKGLISLPRAKRQLEQWSIAGKTINVGECIDWLDRNVRKVGYDDGTTFDGRKVIGGGDGISVPVDYSHYYDAPRAEALKDITDKADNQELIRKLTRGDPEVIELARANAEPIDVSAEVNELTARIELELGVTDHVEEMEKR